MRRSTRTAAAVIATLAIAAPAAQARPAADPAATAPGAQLSIGQLHRIDGNQSPEIARPAPVEASPAKTSLPDGTDATPWIIVAIPLALTLAAGGWRKATHRTMIPRRSLHAHA